MRIVIDARRINTSTGHYVERLLDNLQTLDTTNDYVVIVLEREKNYWKPTAPNFQIIATHADHYTFSEQLTLAWLLYRLKPDFVHFSMPQQPLLWVGKRITTVHDTILIRYKNIDQNVILYHVRKFIFTMLLRNVMWRSKRIITPTRFVKEDLEDWTGRHNDPDITFIHESGEMLYDKPEEIADLKGKPFLFFVGNAFPYKNVRRIVEAFTVLKQKYPDLHLALAGKRDFFYEQIASEVKSRAIPDVHILGYISDGEKRWAMQHAACYVVASLSEGFNIPLLEAMYEGCPVVASNASCLPEVAGKGALYFDPLSTTACAETIDRILSSKELRDKMIKLGHDNTKLFSWEKMSRETKAVYDSVLASSSTRDKTT